MSCVNSPTATGSRSAATHVTDAGMVFFVVTGDDDGDRSDLKSYFGL
jgi:hypothetical protein